MRRHNRMLFRVARSILVDDAESEDALQDAYLAAYTNIDSFQGGAKLSTWLARIVINEALGRLRKRKRAAVVVPFAASGHGESNNQEDAMADASAEQPDAAAMRAELRQLLERRIDELPAQFRTVFILRDVEEMTVEEAAECLDIPAATVRTRAFRARAHCCASRSHGISILPRRTLSSSRENVAIASSPPCSVAWSRASRVANPSCRMLRQ